MNPATDLKRREILQNVNKTCTSLAGKLELLHHRVLKPVEQAKDAVVSTVDVVTDTVSSAKHVVDKVGEQVTKRPWLALCGSMAAGLGAGWLTSGTKPSTEATHNGFSSSAAWAAPLPEKPSFLSKQISKLTGVAVGAGLAVVRDLVKDQLPTWAVAADHITNDLTEQFGAVPFTGPILPVPDSYPASVT